jgi:hypothetical protein
MDSMPQVEMLHHVSSIGRVVVHVVPARNLVGPAVAAAIMRDDAMAPVAQ